MAGLTPNQAPSRTDEELEKMLFGAPAPKTGVVPQAQPQAPAAKFSDQDLEGRLFGQPQAQAKPAPTVPSYAQPTSWLGKVRETLQAANPVSGITFGASDYLPAAAIRGATALGLPGSDRFKGKSIVDIKNESQALQEAQRAKNPIAGGVGTAGELIGGIALTPEVAISKAAGPISRAITTGGFYGGVSGLSENMDPADAIKGAVTGALVGGVATPVLNKTIGGLTGLFKSGKPVVTASGQLTPEAISMARASGLSDGEITALGPHLSDAFKQYGMRPEAVKAAQFSERGIQPTQGMITGDEAQLAREAQYGAPSFQRIQQEAAQKAASETGATMLPSEAAEAAATAAGRKADISKKEAKNAYKFSETEPGAFPRDDISNVGTKILNSFNESSATAGLSDRPLVRQAADALDNALGAAKPTNMPGVSVVHRDFRAVETGRQALNSALGDAVNPADKAAIRSMIDKFDDHIKGLLNDGAFSGDPAVVQKWEQARSLWSDYQNKFGVKKSGQEAGNLLKIIQSENRTPDQVANMIFNFANGDVKMKNTATSTIMQLRRALGPNSPELNEIKSSFMNNLMTPKPRVVNGETVVSPSDFGATARKIDDFLEGNMRGLAKRMLSQNEIESLRRTSSVMKMMSKTSKGPTERNISTLRAAAEIGGPAILSGVGSYLGYYNPTLATIFGVAGAIPGTVHGVKAVRNAPGRQSRLANQPFTGKFAPPRVPGVATIAPRLIPPPQSEEEGQKAGGRIGRATGGKVSGNAKQEAIRLIALAESMKKRHNETTKPLLNVDDNTITKALAVANKGI